ncbi:methyltransferase domain-containing protein [Belliella sp. DSM 111904]|uniref:Methyltransferase domain-containing protein n=1 Tax=Belliella filtrata TaxID=2923435 RepID=A0ABS9UYK2_9BACT|nr:methyltransferase domain-containing protein [Belliella filtrata]MCH7409251.1 methyltransferase domain-containing protein [Belliella filtrata]
MSKFKLFKELFTNISTTGAVTFSSKALVDKMLSYADFESANVIVELGGGDGSITQGIVDRMKPDASLLVFEISEKFCDNLRLQFSQANVKIINDSAENIDKYLDGKHADLILSSLPLSLIPKPVRSNIYQKSKASISTQGKLIQICYSYFLKHQFESYFTKVNATFTLKNFPPVFILICQ